MGAERPGAAYTSACHASMYKQPPHSLRVLQRCLPVVERIVTRGSLSNNRATKRVRCGDQARRGHTAQHAVGLDPGGRARPHHPQGPRHDAVSGVCSNGPILALR
jgi:hypothetical protein